MQSTPSTARYKVFSLRQSLARWGRVGEYTSTVLAFSGFFGSSLSLFTFSNILLDYLLILIDDWLIVILSCHDFGCIQLLMALQVIFHKGINLLSSNSIMSFKVFEFELNFMNGSATDYLEVE